MTSKYEVNGIGQFKEYKIPAGFIRQFDNILCYTGQIREFKVLVALLRLRRTCGNDLTNSSMKDLDSDSVVISIMSHDDG